MENNVRMVQLQIKAFNKALSRADKADLLQGETYGVISDLIDWDRMTKSGYAKAGAKYLEKMTPEELLSYSADIKQAKDLLELEKTIQMVEIDSADPKSLLWQMYQTLQDAGLAFDSDQIQAVLNGDVNIPVRDMALKMNKYLRKKDWGLSDFDEWFNEKAALEG